MVSYLLLSARRGRQVSRSYPPPSPPSQFLSLQRLLFLSFFSSLSFSFSWAQKPIKSWLGLYMQGQSWGSSKKDDSERRFEGKEVTVGKGMEKQAQDRANSRTVGQGQYYRTAVQQYFTFACLRMAWNTTKEQKTTVIQKCYRLTDWRTYQRHSKVSAINKILLVDILVNPLTSQSV